MDAQTLETIIQESAELGDDRGFPQIGEQFRSDYRRARGVGLSLAASALYVLGVRDGHGAAYVFNAPVRYAALARKVKPSAGQMAMNFDEDAHPRAEAGPHGGQFIAKGESTGGASVVSTSEGQATKTPKLTLTAAANQLDSIRNARHDYDANHAELLAKVDAIGRSLATEKPSRKLSKLLTECEQLADQLQGGSGRSGVRIQVDEPESEPLAVSTSGGSGETGTAKRAGGRVIGRHRGAGPGVRRELTPDEIEARDEEKRRDKLKQEIDDGPAGKLLQSENDSIFQLESRAGFGFKPWVKMLETVNPDVDALMEFARNMAIKNRIFEREKLKSRGHQMGDVREEAELDVDEYVKSTAEDAKQYLTKKHLRQFPKSAEAQCLVSYAVRDGEDVLGNIAALNRHLKGEPTSTTLSRAKPAAGQTGFDFDAEAHPRADNGEFASKGGGAGWLFGGGRDDTPPHRGESVPGQQMKLFEADGQRSLFNVDRPTGKKKKKQKPTAASIPDWLKDKKTVSPADLLVAPAPKPLEGQRAMFDDDDDEPPRRRVSRSLSLGSFVTTVVSRSHLGRLGGPRVPNPGGSQPAQPAAPVQPSPASTAGPLPRSQRAVTNVSPAIPPNIAAANAKAAARVAARAAKMKAAAQRKAARQQKAAARGAAKGPPQTMFQQIVNRAGQNLKRRAIGKVRQVARKWGGPIVRAVMSNQVVSREK